MQRTRPGWTRLSRRGAMTCYGWWRHDRSQWEVKHCGHPTANWPYYAITTEGKVVVSPNGRGFQTLAKAMAAVDEYTTTGAQLQSHIGLCAGIETTVYCVPGGAR